MRSLEVGGMIAIGGLGILALGLLYSAQMNLGVEIYFGVGLLIFAIAGATALLFRLIK